jgi:hypothetical protein
MASNQLKYSVLFLIFILIAQHSINVLCSEQTLFNPMRRQKILTGVKNAFTQAPRKVLGILFRRSYFINLGALAVNIYNQDLMVTLYSVHGLAVLMFFLHQCIYLMNKTMAVVSIIPLSYLLYKINAGNQFTTYHHQPFVYDQKSILFDIFNHVYIPLLKVGYIFSAYYFFTCLVMHILKGLHYAQLFVLGIRKDSSIEERSLYDQIVNMTTLSFLVNAGSADTIKKYCYDYAIYIHLLNFIVYIFDL